MVNMHSPPTFFQHGRPANGTGAALRGQELVILLAGDSEHAQKSSINELLGIPSVIPLVVVGVSFAASLVLMLPVDLSAFRTLRLANSPMSLSPRSRPAAPVRVLWGGPFACSRVRVRLLATTPAGGVDSHDPQGRVNLFHVDPVRSGRPQPGGVSAPAGPFICLSRLILSEKERFHIFRARHRLQSRLATR